MFYYLKVFSFDDDRPVVGPYQTASDCYKAMEEDAKRTYRKTELAHVGDRLYLDENQPAGTIRIVETFLNDIDDEILWVMFQMWNNNVDG